jgi:hypothetical protein
MARKPRVHFTGALYHVMSRGNQGQAIFREDILNFVLSLLGFVGMFLNRRQGKMQQTVTNAKA